MSSYPTFCVTVNTVIFSVDTQQQRLLVLLVNPQSQQLESGWCLPWDFVGPAEDLAAVAGRILQDKLTVDHLYLEQLYTFGSPSQRVPTASERALVVSYFALVRLEDAALLTRQGSMTAWFSVGNLPPLCLDQGAIIDYGHHRLRNKLTYSAIAFNVLPELFTLKEVYQLYCIVLGEDFADYSNFRARLLKLGILADTGVKASRGAGRPASLYRFDAAAFAPLKDQPMVFL